MPLTDKQQNVGVAMGTATGLAQQHKAFHTRQQAASLTGGTRCRGCKKFCFIIRAGSVLSLHTHLNPCTVVFLSK